MVNKRSPKKNVLIIGTDLTSNGGIASVVKSYFYAHEEGDFNYQLFLLKTNYYKDKGLLFELLILFKSFFKALYFGIFKSVGVFHIHSSAYFSFYRKSIFVILGKILGKKVILHLHSSQFYDFFLVNNQIVKLIIPLCDTVVVLCSDWEFKLKSKFKKVNIIKIENSHEFDVISEKIIVNKSVFNLLFVGFFIESKGIKDLMQLVKRCRKFSKPSIVIQIAGKGELEKYILEEIENENLQDHCQVIGWVSGESKKEAFVNADAFILPSYKEGMPISILEAMSYGLPIISTEIAGIPDIVTNKKNGFLCQPGDIDAFFKATTALASDTNLRGLISKNNIERVKFNSKENIFAQVDELYNKFNEVKKIEN